MKGDRRAGNADGGRSASCMGRGYTNGIERKTVEAVGVIHGG